MSRPSDNAILDMLTKSGEDITLILESLANERRLLLLTSVLERSRTFSELQGVTGLGKTALAHHLGILVKSSLLKHTRKGHYELSSDGAEFLRSLATAYDGSRKRHELEASRRADYILKTHTKEKKKRMKKLEVRIVKLEPMRVASARAVSMTPENDAWARMRSWAEPKVYLKT